MTFEDVRRIALAWPGVADGTSYGTASLKVGGKFLTRIKEYKDSLVLLGVPFEERDLLMQRKRWTATLLPSLSWKCLFCLKHGTSSENYGRN